MILIKNTQRKIKINTKKIKDDVEKMLHVLGYQDFDLGIWFTTNQTIQRYNKKYRKKDKPTDILSFPYHTDLKPGQEIKVKEDEDKNLGDLIISLEFAQKDVKKLKKSIVEHLQILLVHGIAHLLGYDHKTQKKYRQMQKFENMLLASKK